MDDQIRQVKTGRELSSLDHVPNPAVPLPPQLATFVSSIVTHKYNWVVGYTVEPLYTTPIIYQKPLSWGNLTITDKMLVPKGVHYRRVPIPDVTT